MPYLSENEAAKLQNGDIHLAHNGISQEPFDALRSVMAHFLRFSCSFI